MDALKALSLASAAAFAYAGVASVNDTMAVLSTGLSGPTSGRLTSSGNWRGKPWAVKAGRNDPCPCGSEKKFKKCCYGKVES